jgi:hypothetical protein
MARADEDLLCQSPDPWFDNPAQSMCSLCPNQFLPIFVLILRLLPALLMTSFSNHFFNWWRLTWSFKSFRESPEKQDGEMLNSSTICWYHRRSVLPQVGLYRQRECALQFGAISGTWNDNKLFYRCVLPFLFSLHRVCVLNLLFPKIGSTIGMSLGQVILAQAAHQIR